MKFKKALLMLLVTMVIGTSPFVYANETQVQSVQSQNVVDSLAELYHKAGLDSPEVIINTLANLGISNEDLKEAIGQGKKIYDLLQEKEITLKRFKKALSKEYRYKIKQATKNGVITKQEAKVLTDLLKERMNEWET